jgi:hypothetical protein
MAAFSWLIVTTIALAFVFYPLLDVYFGVCIISSTIVIVVFTWIWTYKLVNRQQKAIHTNQPSSAQEVVSRKKILIRSTVTAFAIILSLLGCYCFGLYYLIFSTYVVDVWGGNHKTSLIMLSVTKTLMYLNSFLNPCLVFWRNSNFRHTVKNTFSGRQILQR